MLLLAVAVSAGCFDNSQCNSYVLGRPSDVLTAPGAYDGYEVIAGCPKSQAQLAVRGLGSRAVGCLDVYDLCDAINKPGTIFGCAGRGIACTTDGASMDVLDWGAVDTIIDRTGRFLKDNDCSEEIAIHVYPPPCS